MLVARVLVLVGLSSVAPLEKGDVKVVAAMFHATPKKSKRARGGGEMLGAVVLCVVN